MSRIGKKPLTVPAGVSVNIEGQAVKVTGAKGELEYTLPSSIEIKVEGDILSVSRKQEIKQVRSLHGTIARILENAIKGVSEGWSKTLELVGTGYRARLEGNSLVLAIGFSHPVKIDPPAGIVFTTEENKIIVSGIDRHLVGQVAANVRAVRPPEPYKGKGIKYIDEYVRRKAGKTAKTATAA